MSRITIKAHNKYEAIRYLDNNAMDYETYSDGDTVTIEINEPDSVRAEEAIERLEEIDIG